MIRLNRLTDYAILVLGRLGREPGLMRTAPQLAQDTGVPLPTVAKLLKILANDGIIASHRGAAGGYTLALPPDAISVAEIIAALEGPIALTACIEGAPGHCDIESLCPMRTNWEKVNSAIRRALEELTLADMAAPSLDFPELPAAASAARTAVAVER
jgi:FeS assembly SUF system regulator